MFFLDEVYATKGIQRPADLQSSRRRSRSSSPGIPDGPSTRPRGVSVSSSEQRDQSNGAKRNSLFSLKQKGSLTTDDEFRSGSPVPTNSGTNLRSSPKAVERPIPPKKTDESQTRLVFTRNGKNSWVTVRPSSPMDADDEGEAKSKSRIMQKKGTSSERKSPQSVEWDVLVNKFF